MAPEDNKLTKRQKKADRFRNKKRKLDEIADVPEDEVEGEEVEAKKPEVKKEVKEPPKKKPAKPRFIVFVGNLPYETTKENLTKHFETAGGIKSVRLITDKQTNKPKGFAFLEFDDPECLKKALFFHHTFFNRRKINVELTAGGGGHSEARKTKLNEKNAKLEEERRKIFESKIATEKAERAAQGHSEKPREAPPVVQAKKFKKDRGNPRPREVTGANNIRVPMRKFGGSK
ncbi:hypothetical protein K493DRAFT_404787 [Basidiobolus meristosporus CBS 931.73]|uniref:RRM domain-containing protein n=1 Tax=Basidiobolus meristosporus CBS 931.73 TaxID=1314790 RepID=A0A1Y1Z1A0_9FUNG|nr:hypothetical protein K493DRAFT_404787 [Basidiobolus meristosporus CBS 931.73]|eukprot:ORY04068.1 hypothetical protein K493DRAFT_404787 [Basidiobolus meristosporus CBS 931.73]